MTKSLFTTKDNWLYFSKTTAPVVNKYHSNGLHNSLTEALIAQAKCIYNDFKDRRVVISMSGGIDSQVAAFAFAKANLPVKYVYFHITFENRPEKERIYVDEFAKRYEVDLEIINYNFSKHEFKNFLIKEKWHPEASPGFQLFRKCYNDYLETYPDTLFVRAPASFYYLREGCVCSGVLKFPIYLLGYMYTYCPQHVCFEFYSTHLFEYYESLHRKNKLLQFHKQFQAKNLAYTELGFDLREKLATPDWFDDDFHKTFNRTSIDFASDLGDIFDLKDTANNILKYVYDYSNEQIASILRNRAVKKEKNSEKLKTLITNLYSFETDVDRYDL